MVMKGYRRQYLNVDVGDVYYAASDCRLMQDQTVQSSSSKISWRSSPFNG